MAILRIGIIRQYFAFSTHTKVSFGLSASLLFSLQGNLFAYRLFIQGFTSVPYLT